MGELMNQLEQEGKRKILEQIYLPFKSSIEEKLKN